MQTAAGFKAESVKGAAPDLNENGKFFHTAGKRMFWVRIQYCE